MSCSSSTDSLSRIAAVFHVRLVSLPMQRALSLLSVWVCVCVLLRFASACSLLSAWMLLAAAPASRLCHCSMALLRRRLLVHSAAPGSLEARRALSALRGSLVCLCGSACKRIPCTANGVAYTARRLSL